VIPNTKTKPQVQQIHTVVHFQTCNSNIPQHPPCPTTDNFRTRSISRPIQLRLLQQYHPKRTRSSTALPIHLLPPDPRNPLSTIINNYLPNAGKPNFNPTKQPGPTQPKPHPRHEHAEPTIQRRSITNTVSEPTARGHDKSVTR
jgi:hypothetical protein